MGSSMVWSCKLFPIMQLSVTALDLRIKNPKILEEQIYEGL